MGEFEMTDDPTTCPYCGARTEFDELPDGTQLHRDRQGHEFIVTPN